MIQFKILRQYTHIVDGIRFPQNPKKPVLVIYFSENSTLLDDYPKMNLKRADFRMVAVPTTKIPTVTFFIVIFSSLIKQKNP